MHRVRCFRIGSSIAASAFVLLGLAGQGCDSRRVGLPSPERESTSGPAARTTGAPPAAAGEEMRILGVSVDHAGRSVHFLVAFGDKRREVKLSPREDGAFGGARAEILDRGTPAFTLTSAVDPETGVHEITEATPADELRITLNPLGDDGVLESYTWLGRTRSWVVPRDEAPIDPETLESFRTFYPGHTTLESNREGERLVAFLSNPATLRWAEDAGAGGTARMNEQVKDACSVAVACSRLKCMAGGAANPICHACTGVTVACAAYTIFCALGLCD